MVGPRGRRLCSAVLSAGAVLVLSSTPGARRAATTYDLVIAGGHVIDPKNNIDGVRDVAIAGGVIAAVAARIDPGGAKTIDASGLYVTPGLVDIHTHVYAGTGEPRSYAGDNSVYPDGFTFRAGVTTIVDAGSSGWRNFEDFHNRVITRSRTRVLALLNIVGHGMRGGALEQDVADMDVAPAVEMARRHRGTIVGFKTAHFQAPAWTPVDRAVDAGTRAGLPVMVDFGADHPERPLEDLVTRKLRRGDIYTHLYSGLRRELLEGRPNPALAEARARGVIFDVGHGAGSFRWRVAVPIVRAGFLPDSISTDLHTSSMNAGMKDMLNVMSKFLALGVPLAQVIAQSTWNPARQLGLPPLAGHLSAGAPADVAVLRLARGTFGFLDMDGARLRASQRLTCELTVRNGAVVYDLNGLAGTEWQPGIGGTRQ